MPGNSFGQLFRITTFGESHGPGIGVVIDGCPPGIVFDNPLLRIWLDRRRPGQSSVVSARNEPDQVEILSGVYEGFTTGAPIAIFTRNKDARPEDYHAMSNLFRPSHADFVYESKYGIRDPRGGGRSSARETAARVMGGAVAAMVLKEEKIIIHAFTSSVGKEKMEKHFNEVDLTETYESPVRCPDFGVAKKMEKEILLAKESGDSIGGVVTCVIRNCPVGLGEPVFDKLNADLAKAMVSIPAVKGFELGSGFSGSSMKGTEHNDIFSLSPAGIKTTTNHSGGIQGGISNGEDIYFRVAFKPASTVMLEQDTVTKEGVKTSFKGTGRHDPCVVPRAVPVVEAMANLVLADHFLRNRAQNFKIELVKKSRKKIL